jgi:hypothetical protein
MDGAGRSIGPMAGFHPYRDPPPRRVEPVQMHPHREQPPAIDQLALPRIAVPAPLRDVLCAAQAICAGAGCGSAVAGVESALMRRVAAYGEAL